MSCRKSLQKWCQNGIQNGTRFGTLFFPGFRLWIPFWAVLKGALQRFSEKLGAPEGAQISQKSFKMRPGGLQRGPQARSKRVSDAKRACDTGLLMIMLLFGLLSLTSGAYLDCILRVPGVISDGFSTISTHVFGGCWSLLSLSSALTARRNARSD